MEKLQKAKELGREIDQIFSGYCWRLGLRVKEAMPDPLTLIELATTEKRIKNGEPAKKGRKKQHNGTGGGEG